MYSRSVIRALFVILFALSSFIPALAISVHEYPIPSGGRTFEIATGPDGNIWFTIRNRAKIGRITPEGVITEFPLPNPLSSPYEIAAGPDGNLWFTEEASTNEYKIGRITPGGVITEFPLPDPSRFPQFLINGNNGALYYYSQTKLVRFETNGTATEYSIPLSTRLGGISIPLVADASGNIHCIQARQFEPVITEYFHLKLTPAGVLTERSLGALPFHSLWDLGRGPDGNIWYSAEIYDPITTISPSFDGFIQLSDAPISPRISTGSNIPLRFISAPDGNFWFFSSTGLVNNILGRASIGGQVVQYETRGLPSFVGVTAGTDGNLWLLNEARDSIVKLIPDAPASAVVTRAASFVAGSVAPDSVAALFGSSLAPATEVATTLPLPTMLAGASVKIKDSGNVDHTAKLFFVSGSQINFAVPSGASPGNAIVTVTGAGGQTVINGTLIIDDVAPGLFAANSAGSGLAAAVALRVKADGSQVYEPVVRRDENNNLVAAPIDLGPETDQVYLILFGSGIRGNSNLRDVRAFYGLRGLPVVFAGAQGLESLDQVNVLLPRDLPRRGEQDVELTVAGRHTNKVRINIR
ncbi:MAG TPA: hypothetical protein VJ810_19345 [Blastocatellia bacterium]|nr:hypothetical protein [Blastocatellia bacterium]